MYKRISNKIIIKVSLGYVIISKQGCYLEIVKYNKNYVALKQIMLHNTNMFKAYKIFRQWVDESNFKLIRGDKHETIRNKLH